MLNVLHKVERALPQLLADGEGWNSLRIDYHPPLVERLWRSYGEHRIYLHRIYPCSKEEALFHPHPWPSAMRVLEGRYEMAIGYGSGEDAPPVAALMILCENSEYEMIDPDGWHYVRPLDGPTMSLMITGKPWDRSTPKSDHALRPLTETEKRKILSFFRRRYYI